MEIQENKQLYDSVINVIIGHMSGSSRDTKEKSEVGRGQFSRPFNNE